MAAVQGLTVYERRSVWTVCRRYRAGRAERMAEKDIWLAMLSNGVRVRKRGCAKEGRQQRDLSCEERAKCVEGTTPKLPTHGHISCRDPDSDITRRAASRATAPQPRHQHRVHDFRKMATEAPQPAEAVIPDAPPPEVSADAAQKPPVKRSWR